MAKIFWTLKRDIILVQTLVHNWGFIKSKTPLKLSPAVLEEFPLITSAQFHDRCLELNITKECTLREVSSLLAVLLNKYRGGVSLTNEKMLDVLEPIKKLVNPWTIKTYLLVAKGTLKDYNLDYISKVIQRDLDFQIDPYEIMLRRIDFLKIKSRTSRAYIKILIEYLKSFSGDCKPLIWYEVFDTIIKDNPKLTVAECKSKINTLYVVNVSEQEVFNRRVLINEHSLLHKSCWKMPSVLPFTVNKKPQVRYSEYLAKPATHESEPLLTIPISRGSKNPIPTEKSFPLEKEDLKKDSDAESNEPVVWPCNEVAVKNKSPENCSVSMVFESGSELEYSIPAEVALEISLLILGYQNAKLDKCEQKSKKTGKTSKEIK